MGYAVGSVTWAFLVAAVIVAGATRWFPRGAAEIDHIVVPAVSFPLVWLGLVVGLLVAQRRVRAWGLSGLAAAGSMGAIFWGFLEAGV